jgi:hypothetical protein
MGVRAWAEYHHRGHRARAGEHRHRERRQRHVLLFLAFDQLGRAFLGRPLGAQHVHGDEPENEAAGDTKGR